MTPVRAVYPSIVLGPWINSRQPTSASYILSKGAFVVVTSKRRCNINVYLVKLRGHLENCKIYRQLSALSFFTVLMGAGSSGHPF